MSAPLAGLRVAEDSRTIAGAYAGKLFADCGAEVFTTGRLDGFLSYGKRVVSSLPPADVLIRETDEPADAPITVDISPYGRGGPRRPWTDFTLQAESGSLRLRGLPDSYPLMAGAVRRSGWPGRWRRAARWPRFSAASRRTWTWRCWTCTPT
nr:hypothetical protein GCM10020093_006530 [Planobispora longispora]